MTDQLSCCRHGLRYPDGQLVCHRHSTPDQRALVADLDERARETRLLGDRGWPYGPNIDVASRERLLSWAERDRLALASTGCQGMHWLRTGRCGVRFCEPLGHWADHVTRWKRDGKPALIVAQPYGLSDQDMSELGQMAADESLYISVDAYSWYGHGTVMVEIWNRQVWNAKLRER